jgi:hypothetical protein
MARKPSARTRRDRWADWAVVLVFAAALLLGWAVMAYAEGQQETFVDSERGLTVYYPQDWLLKQGQDLAFEAVDPTSGGFKTSYQIRVWPIDATAALTPSLASVLSDASLARAQQATAYRLFDVVPGKGVNGQPTMEATYAFVVEGSDLFVQTMPAVIQGLDVAVPHGDQAYVFTLLASKEAYEAARPAFLKFVRAAELGSASGN